MDKRTILAVILSFFVLMIYNSMVIKPTLNHQSNITDTQNIAVKGDAINLVEKSTPPASQENTKNLTIIPQTLQPQNFSEILQTFENNEVIFSTSNIGGTIKSLTIKKYSHQLPLMNIANLSEYQDKIFYVDESSTKSIRYVYSDEKFKITKQYELSENGEYIKINLDIKNISNMSNLDKSNIVAFEINNSNFNENTAPLADRSLFEYSVSSNGVVFRKGNAFAFSSKENSEKPGAVKWVGFRDKYFYAMLIPRLVLSEGYGIHHLGDKNLQIHINSKQIKLDPGDQNSYSFSLCYGLQDFIDSNKVNPEIREIVVFSNISFIDFVSKSILRVMKFTHKIIPNWGFCIIIISILVYFSMYPLTLNGMRSMKKMQAIQPRMAQLREQYKNQPQKLNREVMELYKEHGVNPLGGCLPFILQMPVFVGLYQALWRTIYLKGQGFLWIKDLSQPDRLFIFPMEIPILGKEFNILPIVMAIVMFLQQKISSKTMIATDSTQQTQQKMMLIFMPIMMGFVFYKFASGLTLYFTMFYAFSAVTQYKMSKVEVK